MDYLTDSAVLSNEIQVRKQLQFEIYIKTQLPL